jgi:hypothetical protein
MTSCVGDKCSFRLVMEFLVNDWNPPHRGIDVLLWFLTAPRSTKIAVHVLDLLGFRFRAYGSVKSSFARPRT